jgi:hypothetical protein
MNRGVRRRMVSLYGQDTSQMRLPNIDGWVHSGTCVGEIAAGDCVARH